MKLLIGTVGLAFAFAALAFNEPGPQPREVDPLAGVRFQVGPPDADGRPGAIIGHDRYRLYCIEVFVNDVRVTVYGADAPWGLDDMLKAIAIRFLGGPQQWEVDPETGWVLHGKPIPPPRVHVRIHKFNEAGGDWHHPGGKRMPPNWDGKLPVSLTANFGSYRVE